MSSFSKTAVIASLAALSAIHANAAPTAGWYQDSEEVEGLFKRQSSTASLTAKTTTSDSTWSNWYPTADNNVASTSNLPQSWLDRLDAVTSQSSFPKYAPSTLSNGSPVYPDGLSPTDPTVCSFTYQCIESDDIYNGPDGTIGINFDDGPTESSQALYPFLIQNNVSATHFMIGGNIYSNPAYFKQAVDMNGHIAVHTWSHNYMTTLTNEQIVAELGYTMQIIYEASGKVAAYWRPPYGDVDNRVRGIASGVFGLKTVVWNQDTDDWAIGSDPKYTHDSVVSQYTKWCEGPKSPGLIVLEHEITQDDVSVFTEMYPIIVKNGWKITNIADAFGLPWYHGPAGVNVNTTFLQTGALNKNGTLVTEFTPSKISFSSSSPSATTIGQASSVDSTNPTHSGSVTNAAAHASATAQNAKSGAVASASPIAATLILGLLSIACGLFL